MIRLQEVWKSFGTLAVLRGVSLQVGAGETVAVIGRSGSGKSVLLRHIAALHRPDEGRIFVDGREISSAPRDEVLRLRRRMGYVFQFAALFDSLTVGDNVRVALRGRGLSRADMEDRVRHCLEVVDLAGEEARYPAQLSGGMRKRAGIARAIAAWPDFLLYDEPTTGLDPVTTAHIDDLIIRLREELGATSIAVTHDMESAYRIADRIAMLHGGRVHAAGAPEEIRASEDPIVRSFVEGRSDLWPGAVEEAVPGGDGGAASPASGVILAERDGAGPTTQRP